MSDNWTDELSQFDDDYREAEIPTGEGVDTSVPVPDGVYQAKVLTSELAHSKSSNNPMIKICLEITGGQKEMIGRWLWKNQIIQSQALPFIKKDLALFGIRLPDFHILPTVIHRLEGKVVECRKRSKNGYTNIDLLKVKSPVGKKKAEEPPPEEPTEDSEVPF